MTLDQYIKRNKISVLEMARRLKMHPQLLYDYKHGKTMPPLDKALKIVNFCKRNGAYSVSFEDLLEPHRKRGESSKAPSSRSKIKAKKEYAS